MTVAAKFNVAFKVQTEQNAIDVCAALDAYIAARYSVESGGVSSREASGVEWLVAVEAILSANPDMRHGIGLRDHVAGITAISEFNMSSEYSEVTQS